LSLSFAWAAANNPRVAGELCATEIRAANELCTGDLHDIELCVDEPRFAQAARRCCAEKRML
jgi:hypothetical protein